MTYPRRLLVATTNGKKGEEMRQILSAADLGIEIVSLADYPDAPPVEETGETFMENALLKAEAAAAYSGLVSIADDGGLCIDALGGQPGVKSHRFLGEEAGFPEKMARILAMMREAPEAQRSCRFQCAVVISAPEGPHYECTGFCEGRIAYEPKGTYGFGYDPIVLLPELGKHMAELMPEEKHRISHRGKALECAVRELRALFP